MKGKRSLLVTQKTTVTSFSNVTCAVTQHFLEKEMMRDNRDNDWTVILEHLTVTDPIDHFRIPGIGLELACN